MKEPELMIRLILREADFKRGCEHSLSLDLWGYLISKAIEAGILPKSTRYDHVESLTVCVVDAGE